VLYAHRRDLTLPCPARTFMPLHAPDFLTRIYVVINNLMATAAVEIRALPWTCTICHRELQNINSLLCHKCYSYVLLASVTAFAFSFFSLSSLHNSQGIVRIEHSTVCYARLLQGVIQVMLSWSGWGPKNELDIF
jgi:hypothetical protein